MSVLKVVNYYVAASKVKMEASIGDPSLFVTVKVKSVGHWATSSVEETAASSKV